MPMIVLHCAAIPAKLPAKLIARWLERLPAERAASLSGALAAGRGLDSLTALALLAGCARLRRLPPLSRLSTGSGGKPFWPAGPDFSITHAAGVAVCAIAPPGVAIGIDLEPDRGVELDALRCVTDAAERARVRAGALSAAGLWTCKEAVLKAAGAGVLDAGQVEIDGAVGHHAGRRYHLTQLDLGRQRLLAIATTAPVGRPLAVWIATSVLFDDPSPVASPWSSA